MPKQLYRGCFIRFYDGRFDEDAAASYVKLNVTTDFSEPIANEMGWNALSFLDRLPQPAQKAIADYIKEHGQVKWLELAGVKSASLKGKINATTMELIPSGEMKAHAITLECNEVKNFTLVRLTDKDGNTTGTELRFQIITSAKGAGQTVANYVEAMGKGAAQLRIGYSKQEDLNLKADHDVDDDEETDTPDSERLISKEQAADTSAATDQPGENAGPTLAPAREVGGTHQRNTRQQQGRRGEARDRERESVADGTAIQ